MEDGTQGQSVAPDASDQLWDEHLNQQIYLGNDAFIMRMQKLAGIDSAKPAAIRRDQSITDAICQGRHGHLPIALGFGVSSSTVSRVVAEFERDTT